VSSLGSEQEKAKWLMLMMLFFVGHGKGGCCLEGGSD